MSRPLRSRRIFTKLSALTGGAAILTAVIHVVVLAGRDRPDDLPMEVSAWWLAVAFAACQAYAIWVERQQAAAWGHTLSFVPLAVGLLYTDPLTLTVARMGGVALVLILTRHRRPSESLYELSVVAVKTSAAVLAFDLVLGNAHGVGVQTTFALLAGLFTSWSVAQAAYALVVGALAGWPGWRAVGGTALSGTGSAVLNAAIGSGLTVALWDHPHVGLLLSAIVVSSLLSNRLYTGVSERHRRLEALHEFAQGVVRSVDLAEVGASVLHGARSLLRADQAVLLLAPLSEGDHASQRVLSSRGITTTEIPLEEYLRDLRALVPRMVPRRVRSDQGPRWLADDLRSASALAAPITNADGRVTGVLVVSQARRRVTTGFGDAHARHLGALAHHASIAIENGVLFTRLEREAAQRAHQALHDQLTGLPNRVQLIELLEEAIEESYAARGRLGLLVVDLDSFSQVIDAFGHRSADELLRQACARVQRLVPEGSVVCRLGGEQFAILLRDVDIDEAVSAARLLMAGFDPPFQTEGVLLALGLNVGVAVYPEHAIDVPSLVQRAHIAADAARRHRTGWEIYDPVHDPATPRRLALGADLREALEVGDLDVCFQPKVEMATGVVRGAEALVRWNHPRLGRVRPSEFIGVAEHTGDIRTLTMAVMRSSLAQCRAWRDLGLDLSVAVNLSARNLLDLHLVDDVARLVEESDIPPAALVLEITESMVMSETKRSAEVLAGLSELGVCLSCDDFGTGYSSLAHLQRLPIGEIKVDRTFVAGMAVDDNARSIARWMLSLGRDLGLRTVAEGVESRETWDLLVSLGCDLAQGFIVCPPLMAHQFGEWLDRRQPGELPLLEQDPTVIDVAGTAPDAEADSDSGAQRVTVVGESGAAGSVVRAGEAGANGGEAGTSGEGTGAGGAAPATS
ncbi:MAG: putative bifunctional diguanylate cyclase/phosphodiesterase [Acidimicrobiia bacterium]